MQAIWLSCVRFTVLVEVDADDVVRVAPPIVRRFIGQPVANLERWMERMPGFRVVSL